MTGKALYFLMCSSMCKEKRLMATNLALDDELLNQALKIGGFKSKKDTVNAALKAFIEKNKQKEIIELFGKIDYDDDYDHKKGRM